jgi:hypothetical protein
MTWAGVRDDPPTLAVLACRRHLVRRVIALGLLAITLYVLGPAVARTLSSWPTLKNVDPLWLIALAGAQAASNASLCWLQLLAMRTTATWGNPLPSTG